MVRNSWQKMESLSMINQNQIMVLEMKLEEDVLKSNLCDYKDAYILVSGDITVRAPSVTIIITNFAQFTKWITKLDGRIIDDAESLDLVLPMCNLIEYSL